MVERATLQILADYCQAAAEAMAFTLIRTAHSTFVKETEDFSCGVLTPEGLTFASPKGLGATWFLGLDYGNVIKMIDGYEDGDVCITNDPYSGFVATHTPDMHIWKPVFLDGELMCFVAGHIHNTDMGGAVPASLSRTLTEIVQEGVRIPPTKLVSRGNTDERILKILGLNVRAPRQNHGDLQAQLASVAVGERKVKEIIARFGKGGFRKGMRDLLEYGEQQARRIISTIPDGDYVHAEYADEDSEGGPPCRVLLTARIRGSSVELDFTGSDPQVNASLNLPTGGHERHALVMVGLGYVLYTLDKNLLLNAGALRCARAILPEGTVVNAQAPAAVGMRSMLCTIAQVATIGAFAKAVPDRLPASPAGGQTIINVRALNRRGVSVMASVGPIPGGAGGRAQSDGVEGAGANSAFLKNTPIEVSEAEVPIRFRRYGLQPDTGGPGKWRGGTATIMEFEVFSPQTMITARNRDRSRFGSWGLKGGQASATSTFDRNPDRPDHEALQNRDIVVLEPGNVLRCVGTGGGGWGDPFDRDPDLVLRDVRKGLVTPDHAREAYGVVITGDAIDFPATREIRNRSRVPGPLFDFGPGRRAFEEIWTEERYAVLTEVLTATAIPWRHWVKKQIFAAVSKAGAPGQAGSEIRDLYGALTRRFPHLACAEGAPAENGS